MIDSNSGTGQKVRELVDEWRGRADLMDENIDEPTERQKWVMGNFRSRANELEFKVLDE